MVYIYNGVEWDIVAAGGDTVNGSKYAVSKNPSTGLYYRLHILNVGVSDVEKYRCEAGINGMILSFYLQLIILGRCTYILVIFKVGKREREGERERERERQRERERSDLVSV